MKRSIQEFKNMYQGQDIWVIAKGASLNYVNKSFFDGRITVGINDIDLWIETTFLMRKEFSPTKEGLRPEELFKLRPNTKLVMSEYEGCVQEWGKNEERSLNGIIDKHDVWIFKTPFTHGELVLPRDGTDDELPAALSSTAMAMYFAYFLGAKNILLCGNDECMLDGKHYADGLPPYACSSDHAHILRWQASESIVVRNLLRDRGINIYSLNPFINLRLEGHTYV